MDPVDNLIVDESPTTAKRLVVLDAPDLVEAALGVSDDVRVWCDDARERDRVPEELRASTLDVDLFEGADLVWMRLPKSLGALDEYAELIADSASAEAKVIAGGRVKHMTLNMNEVLASHFGHVSASLGRQKSRVLRAGIPMATPLTWPRRKTHADLKVTLVAHGATFAGTKVDPGTRLLLKHLGKVQGVDLLDYGSGNGIIATLLARTVRGSRVKATDVSWAAASATEKTADANRVHVEAHWLPNLDDWADESLDAIVTNPPFHRGTTKDSADAEEMFTTGGRLLRPGGEFWCVFNSHLPWKAKLTAAIGPTKVMEQNTGYTLTRSERR